MRDEWGFIVACLFKPVSFDSRAAHIMTVKQKEMVKAAKVRVRLLKSEGRRTNGS